MEHLTPFLRTRLGQRDLAASKWTCNNYGKMQVCNKLNFGRSQPILSTVFLRCDLGNDQGLLALQSLVASRQLFTADS